MAKWNPAGEDLARECETRFQNGGPRVYVQDEGAGSWNVKPTQLSASKAVLDADQGQIVLARRKDGQRYVWKWAKA